MAPDKVLQKLEAEIIYDLPKLTRGSGTEIPKEFVPGTPNGTPASLFFVRPNGQKSYMERFTCKRDYNKALVYAEGAARYPEDKNNNNNNSNNNTTNTSHDKDAQPASSQSSGATANETNTSNAPPRGGWAYMYGPCLDVHVYGGRLEQRGPFGDEAAAAHSTTPTTTTLAQTRGRAALRAVLAALRCRPWTRDGYTGLVVATGSAYVVRGATADEGPPRWMRSSSSSNGSWTTRRRVLALGEGEGEGVLDERVEVPDHDLWQALLGEVERYAAEGLRVEFWLTSSDEGLNAIVMHKAWDSCNKDECVEFHEVPAAGF
jgi:hypothetical protein